MVIIAHKILKSIYCTPQNPLQCLNFIYTENAKHKNPKIKAKIQKNLTSFVFIDNNHADKLLRKDFDDLLFNFKCKKVT